MLKMFPGCTGEVVWWKERRGVGTWVGRAEVPGEEDSEGNRPNGLAPV